MTVLALPTLYPNRENVIIASIPTRSNWLSVTATVLAFVDGKKIDVDQDDSQVRDRPRSHSFGGRNRYTPKLDEPRIEGTAQVNIRPESAGPQALFQADPGPIPWATLSEAE